MLSDNQKGQIKNDWNNAQKTEAMKQMTAIFQSAPASTAHP
jgi:hypothetical protein